MKKILSLILVLSFSVLCCSVFVAAADRNVNVKLVDSNTEFAVETAEIISEEKSSESMLRIIGKTVDPCFDFESTAATDAVVSDDGRFVLQFDGEAELVCCLEEMKNDPCVIYAERDVPVYTAALEEEPEEEHLSWGVQATEADKYSQALYGYTGDRSVTVAIIDSGCKNIEFIRDRLVKGYDFVDNDDDATNDTSLDSHGTFLATIVTDCTRNLPVSIMPVRVLSTKSGSLINVVNGIYYAVDNGADILNMSLGGAISNCSSIDEAVEYAEQKNVSVIVSAGNSKTDVESFCPAHNETAITVTSVGEENVFSESFSNYGSHVDIAAPGENIDGYDAKGKKITLSGTSMSAAFVSAGAAMYKLAYPNCTAAQIQMSLTSAAEDLGEPGWDEYYGHGVLRLSGLAAPGDFHTVEWSVDGSVTSEVYIKGEKIIMPEAPTKYGYTFGGWLPDVPEAMPDEDMTFTCLWIPVKCIVTFDAATGSWQDGSTQKICSFDFDTVIVPPEAPSKTGFVFQGWSDDGINPVSEIGKTDTTDGKTFYAVWVTAGEARYTVETYRMNTEGTYDKRVSNLTGKVGTVVKADFTQKEGFTLNEKLSVLSGTVTHDGSLVLKIYADRNKYTLTTVVDTVESVKEYYYEAPVPAPAAPFKAGYKFIGWNQRIPMVMPAENITVTAVFEAAYNCPDCGNEIIGEEAIKAHLDAKATVKIRNNTGSATVDYGETLLLAAITTDKPADATVVWYVDGVESGKGETFRLSFDSGTKTVEVKLVDADGNVIRNTSGKEIADSEAVTVRDGFFRKIISFFKNLFGMNRTVVQTIFKKAT